MNHRKESRDQPGQLIPSHPRESMKISPFYQALLVSFQLALMTLLIILGWQGMVREWGWMILSIFGFSLGFWALRSMGFTTFQMTPEPKGKAHLCREGPYQLIRHPMYSAALLAFFPFAITSHSPLLSWVSLGLLALVFLQKILIEERYWLEREPTRYRDYISETKRLIPFIC